MYSRRVVIAAAVAGVGLAAAGLLLVAPRNAWRQFCQVAARRPYAAGRLSLITVAQAPPQIDRGGSHRSPVDFELVAAANAVIASNATEEQKAAAALVGGDAIDAERRLARLIEQKGAGAGTWSDYALAQAAAADSDEHADLFFSALAAVDHALELDPRNAAALFNRAVILDRMGLRSHASAAFAAYRAQDRMTPWAETARLRIASLNTAAPDFRAQIPEMERAADAGEIPSLQSIALRYRQESRAWTETDFLGRWGEATIANDGHKAVTLLTLARSLAEAVSGSGGDRMSIDEVSAIDRASGDTRMILARAHASYRRGRAAYSRREVAAAARDFDEALTLFESAGAPMALTARCYRASAAMDIGDRRRATADLIAVESKAANHYEALMALAEWLRGSVAVGDGVYGDALTHYREAIDLFDRVGEEQYASDVRFRLASLLSLLGRPQEAWSVYTRCLRVAGAHGDSRTEESILYAAATEALREQQWATCASLLTVAADIKNGNPRTHAEVMSWRILAVHAAGLQRAEAAATAEAAQALEAVADPGLRAIVLNELKLAEALATGEKDTARTVSLLDEYIGAARDIHQTLNLPEALTARAHFLRARGRSFEAERDLGEAITIVETRNASVGSSLLRDSFLGRWNQPYQELADLYDAEGSSERVLDTCDRRRARIVMDALGEGSVASRSGRQLDVAAVARELQPRGVLLAFERFHDRVVLMVLTRRGLQRIRLPETPAEMDRAMSALTEAIASRDGARVAAAGKNAYRLFLAPAAGVLASADSVVIVGDEWLQNLPIGALALPDGEPAVSRYSFVFAPSVDFWLRTREVRPPVARSIVAVGNPAFDRERYPSLLPLTAAETEARTVGALYPRAVVLTGANASRERFLDALKSCTAVQLGSHAILDSVDGRRSRLLLASVPGSDGEISAADIASLDLRHVEVVVLAGCDTAAEGSGYGYVRSLAAAFLAAGARNVIASLWQVNDDAARQFAVLFHRSLARGETPAAAAREAENAMWRSGPFRDARHWAAFQVYGAAD